MWQGEAARLSPIALSLRERHGPNSRPRWPLPALLLVTRRAENARSCRTPWRRGKVLAGTMRDIGWTCRLVTERAGSRRRRRPPSFSGDHRCLEQTLWPLRSRTSQGRVSGCCLAMRNSCCRFLTFRGFVKPRSISFVMSRGQRRITFIGANWMWICQSSAFAIPNASLSFQTRRPTLRSRADRDEASVGVSKSLRSRRYSLLRGRRRASVINADRLP